VVDVGTISVRLLVARVNNGQVDDVVRRAQVTRLGEGLRSGGLLSVAAKARTAEAAKRFIEEARDLGAESIAVVGTSATRDAADGRWFLQSLAAVVQGVEAAVLTGEEEAAATYAGVCVDVEGDPVVLDIGGGSTEVVRRGKNGALAAVSLDLGASRATDSWIRSDPPSAEELAWVKEEVERVVRGVEPRFGRAAGGSALVGVAGTVTTLACLDAGLEEYRREVIHLRRLELESVRGLLARLATMSSAQRAGLPCVQPGRAPVIVGGAAVLAAVMETLGYGELIVSERDLLDGLILRGSC
jgi:exopolyphosphatase/guanosine-5'-triphosphate,3'-diphosphate pyrophosphatase